MRFFARESCGKCTPCREGTRWLEKILRRILDGDGRPDDLDLLLDVCDNISPGIAWPPRQTTICPLGPSAVSPIASAIERFRDEFEAYIGRHRSTRPWHRRHGRHRRPEQERPRPTPEADPSRPITGQRQGDRGPAKGELVIDAAERAGTYIPRFCYHPRMEPVGMCRMCLVEIDTGRGPALAAGCMIAGRRRT